MRWYFDDYYDNECMDDIMVRWVKFWSDGLSLFNYTASTVAYLLIRKIYCSGIGFLWKYYICDEF